MTHPKPYPLLANRVLRKAARAEQAIDKHKQRMTQGLEAYAKAALTEKGAGAYLTIQEYARTVAREWSDEELQAAVVGVDVPIADD